MLLVFMVLENARQYDDRISHDDFPFLEVLSEDYFQPQTKLGWEHKLGDQNDKHLKMGQIYFKIRGLFPATERVHAPAAATMRGCVVGADEPAAGSTVTATAPKEATSTGPESMCKAERASVDWNNPAGRGAPPLGISHIS